MKGSDAAPIPETKAECLELAQRWGHTLSYNNLMLDMEPGTEGEHRQQTLIHIAQADAAEVARLAALFPILPETIGDHPRRSNEQ